MKPLKEFERLVGVTLIREHLVSTSVWEKIETNAPYGFSIKVDDNPLWLKLNEISTSYATLRENEMYYIATPCKTIWIKSTPVDPSEVTIWTNIDLVNIRLRGSDIVISGALHCDCISGIENHLLTDTPLGANATYTSPVYDLYNRKIARVTLSGISNVASKSNGVHILQSWDSTNWDFDDKTTFMMGSATLITKTPKARYVKFFYENGTSAQTYFRLGCLFNNVNLFP